EPPDRRALSRSDPATQHGEEYEDESHNHEIAERKDAADDEPTGRPEESRLPRGIGRRTPRLRNQQDRECQREDVQAEHRSPAREGPGNPDPGREPDERGHYEQPHLSWSTSTLSVVWRHRYLTPATRFGRSDPALVHLR